MINYSKTAIALGLLTMLSISPAVASNAVSAARVESNDASTTLPTLNVSFPQYTYRYTTANYNTFVQPAPVGDVEGETPTITTSNTEVVTINGNTIALTGKTGFVNITYTYPATDSHAETKAYYSIIVTAAEPILVGSLNDWNNVVSSRDECANIKLTSDITLDTNNKTFYQFSGILDGDGHTITVDFNNSTGNIGLFNFSNGAYIKNLRVAGKIINTSTEYPHNIGGFFGSTTSLIKGFDRVETVIENCMSSIEINANGRNDIYVGGFIGKPQGPFTIKNCLFDGKITSSGYYGRFVCGNWDDNGSYYKSTITHCLSTGNIDSGNSVYNSKASVNEEVYVADNKTEYLGDGTKLAVNDSILNGSFCYKVLNGNIDGGPWKQHIGYEKYPSLASQYVVKVADYVFPDIWVNANSLSTMALPVSIPAENPYLKSEKKIYTVNGAEGDVLQLVEFTKDTIPAGLPVIIYNPTDKKLSFYARLYNTLYYNDEQTDNLLQTVYFSGNEKSFYAPAGSYVLQKKKDAKFPAFYRVQNDNQIKIAQFKCYLKAPSANAAPCFYLPVDDTTGIDSVESDNTFEGDGKIYDLSGRRVNEMQKGQVYIIGGHKVMVK